MHILQQHERLEQKPSLKNLSHTLTANQDLGRCAFATGFATAFQAIGSAKTEMWRFPASPLYLLYRKNRDPVEQEKRVDILPILLTHVEIAVELKDGAKVRGETPGEAAQIASPG
jgi:HD-like signal output (HDOD) protein